MVKSCNPADYPQFDRLSSETIREKAEKIIKWIWESESAIPRNRLFVSDDCIAVQCHQ
jgi:hypothetical protein